MAKSEKYISVEQMTDKQQINIVKSIFKSIPNKYDFLNQIFSVYQDRYWRRKTVSKMNFFDSHEFLDIATGTADLAIDCAQTYDKVKVTGVDFVNEILQKGIQKVDEKKLASRINLRWGDALSLGFKDNSFDVSAIAFGIRNIPNREKALLEMKRVVISNGQIIILELTKPKFWLLRWAYFFYLNIIMPFIAKIFTKEPIAYKYLADSIMNFPEEKEFLKLMNLIGLRNCKAIPLTFGVCTLYIGEKK
ncbi:MAG: hypothetical protein CMG08_03675 [Candidatus Marinimicrobia bacterium]|nr:hypothetical protein [Candidatus Neomarinimicrobiota bacterium]